MNLRDTITTTLLNTLRDDHPRITADWLGDITPIPNTQPGDEVTIHYNGDIEHGTADPRWGVRTWETHEEEVTCTHDAEDTIRTLHNLLDENWNITLIEFPTHMLDDINEYIAAVEAAA